MQKLKLQNKWDKNSNSFNKNEFELKETDKMIMGKVSVSSKQNGKYVSKTIPFILFKSQTDLETQNAVKSGEFEASFGIGVNEFEDKEGKKVSYHQLIINEARAKGIDKHNQDKANGYQPQEEMIDDVCPF